MESQPPRGEIVYDVSLLGIRDLTPEDTTDNKDGSDTLGEVRLAPTSYQIETTSLYTFVLYTFDNVTLPEDMIVMYLDVYYGGAIDYESPAYGSIRVYHRDVPWIDLALTKEEIKSLRDGGK